MAPARNPGPHRRTKSCTPLRLAFCLLASVVVGALVLVLAHGTGQTWHFPGSSPLADSLAQSIARHDTEGVSNIIPPVEFLAESHAGASLQLKKSAKVPSSHFECGSTVSDKELFKLQEEHLNAAMRAVNTEPVPNAVPPQKAGSKPFSLGVRSDGRINVLFVVADDCRPESAVYGQGTPTSNIARLARRGVTFDRAYAQITVCNPSRTSFLTGRAPDVIQVFNFERAVQGPIVAMPEYFRHHGYTVLGTGKVWHWEPGPGYDSKIAPFWPDNRLFQKLMRRDRLILKTMNRTISPFDGLFETFDFEFVDAVFAKRACRLIDLLAVGKAENGESLALPKLNGPFKSILDTRPPFFLAVGFHLPHEPYLIPDASWRDFDDSKDRRLRGPISVRPFGMPPYAGGDMFSEELENLKRYQAFGVDQLAGYQYVDTSTDRGSVEISGQTYGPMSDAIPGESPLERYHRDAPFPDLMRSEIYRGYATGVSYMDKQLGKVLDRLRDTGLEESTVVVFCSDHGYDLGERGQWGKRNLFESDARVPLIVADPRFPKAHSTRTPLFAELVDLFPTLTDLAGIAPPLALVPPLSGLSLASIVHSPAHATSPRKFAVTQFSRCPITASEYLQDIQGKGPLIMQAQVSVDYRTRPDKGAQVGNWECAWKGWEWSLHHDLVLMGYSLRSDKWRYTAWVLWDSNTTLPVWTYPPFGEELYAHPMGAREPPGLFDELETVNLLVAGGLDEDHQETSTEHHRKIARWLFDQLRVSVIERRGSASDAFYMCDRVANRAKRVACQAQAAAAQGYDGSLQAQVFGGPRAQTVDSRPAQREPSLAQRLKQPVLTLPFAEASAPVGLLGRLPSLCSPNAKLELATLLAAHMRPTTDTPAVDDSAEKEAPIKSTAALPPAVAGALRRLRLFPDAGARRLDAAVAAYESVARAGDEVWVGDAGTRLAQLNAHRLCRPWAPASGARFRVTRVLPLNGGRGPADLLFELVRLEGSITSGDTQAMGLGYMARRPLSRFAEAAQEALQTPTRAAWLDALPLVVDVDAPGTAAFFAPSLDPHVVPQLLYAPSRAPALRQGASWADRMGHVQWLPVDLAAFDRRLRSLS